MASRAQSITWNYRRVRIDSRDARPTLRTRYFWISQLSSLFCSECYFHGVSACLLKMSSCTDPLGLNENTLFKDLRKCLSKITKETKNILEIRDDTLFVWNAEKCCILTLNITEVRGQNEDVPYQVRLFMTNYTITFILYII